ncbi:SusC/RagA family TonB-linked outer membrane protein, partial [Myroides pelagicus]|uniref:SusC/RagA family TonB-linked outer membrane protein n=1 Tax=Myroides pelagicus TaxID=270914 RepID=UPI002DB8C07D
SIEVAKGQTLVFSMIGFKDYSIVYNNQSIVNVTLKQDTSTLDEIVVNAGYYSVKDRERTGSIARVTAKDIELQPVTNPLQALQGRMAGVNITQQTGIAGGGMDVEIRGLNFMGAKKTGRNNPLYIIDGVPFSSSPMAMGLAKLDNMFPDGISPLNAINPSDIENVEVLKDADATAIYGSRGANGVILITTKKAKLDHTSFILSSSTAFSKVPKFLKLMDTKQYIQMREQAFANSGITTYPINAYDVNGTWDKDRYTNWQKELIGDTAIDKNISLGINAGNQYSSFKVNFSHNESTTVFPTDKGYKRNNILLNYNYRSKNNKLTFNSSTTYSNQENDLPNIDFTKTAITLAPNAPSLYNDKGELNWHNGKFANPLINLNQSYQNTIESLILNGGLSYNILPNTFLKVNTGLTTTNMKQWQLKPHTMYNPSLQFTPEASEAVNLKTNSKALIIEPQINYLKTWNKHSVNILLGSTYQFNTAISEFLIGRNYSTNASLKNLSTAKERIIGGMNSSEYKYASIFTRINYVYNTKYILNLTARRDGSSRFGKSNRFGNFGAIGTAWVFSKEDIFKDYTWLNFGKIRSSYGVTGSDNIGDYAYLDTYTISPIKYNQENGLYPTSLYNPNYKWEKTKKFEVALELELFNSRINPSIAYYNNTSTDQLVGLKLPSTTGFNSINSNSAAVVRNTGWEFTLNTLNISNKHWYWSTNFNLSLPKNKLASYPGLEEGTQSSFYVIGKPINIIKTYQYLGIDPNTGYYMFKDFNQDGRINANDKKLVKDLSPKLIGGLQNTITYKNLSVDFLFYFIQKDSYNINNYYNTPGDSMNNLPIQMTDRWSLDNLNATYIASTYGKPSSLTQSTNFKSSDKAISDASYIRLKNLSISYNLKIPQVKIESLRLYLQGQNLWTITSYKGIDPEFTSFGYLPPLRTYAFGMQLTF